MFCDNKENRFEMVDLYRLPIYNRAATPATATNMIPAALDLTPTAPLVLEPSLVAVESGSLLLLVVLGLMLVVGAVMVLGPSLQRGRSVGLLEM